MLQNLRNFKIILLSLFTCITAMGYSQAKASFPYTLSKADIPAGFVVSGPFTKEEKELSISANRGIVTNKELIANIYEHINVKAISRVYVTSYVPGKHAEDGLEVYIIECKSRQMLDKEQAKLARVKGNRYLEKGNYLFIIWSSGKAYPKQIDTMAEQLKQRWGLRDISK